jgi:ParB family chromosome partitioning protein
MEITKKKEKPRHLGRGLQSLLGPIMTEQSQMAELDAAMASNISNFPVDKELREALRELPVEIVMPNPYQPRTSWNETDLKELADSIKANGVVQPIVVRPAGGGYELIAGERRLRATKMAGLETIPAIVRQATDEQLLELALVENIHRSDLNPIERAKAYHKYLQTFSLTQESASQRLGENRSVIANYIRLLDLPDEIKKMLVNGELSMGHARAILALPTDDLRRKLANKAMAGRLSVREIERLVRLCLQGGTDSGKRIKYKAPHIAELETRLSRHLGTRVAILARKSGQRGKILIEFGSLDEFDRISEQLGVQTVEEI